MNISKDLQIIDTALYFTQERILVINDLHIGYEEELHKKGVLVPRFQLKEILEKIEKIIVKTNPHKVIINGDLKHEFGRISRTEWKETLTFLDFLLGKVKEVIIIRGNHDPIIKPIANKRNVRVVTEYKTKSTLIVHGDELVDLREKEKNKYKDIKRIIIGHEHPAITLREGSKWEKYKCFLKGRWKKKELIAVPSFNPLLEGTDILKEKLLSPFLENIEKFDVLIVHNGEAFDFGKIQKLKKNLLK